MVAIQPSNRGPRSRRSSARKRTGCRPCQSRIDPVQLGVIAFPYSQLRIVRRQPETPPACPPGLQVSRPRRPADFGIASGRSDVERLAVKQAGGRKRAKRARFRTSASALDLFLQVELDVGTQRRYPVVGVPDYRQAAVWQEGIPTGVDRAAAQEVDAGRFSFRADDPVRMKRRPLPSTWRCASLSRPGSRCISSTNAQPLGTDFDLDTVLRHRGDRLHLPGESSRVGQITLIQSFVEQINAVRVRVFRGGPRSSCRCRAAEQEEG